MLRDDGALALDDVVYDLPLDGQWSDLTARFEIQKLGDWVVLVLAEIHVF